MTARLLAWVPAIAWAGVIYGLSAQPTVPAPDVPNIDKVLHFGAYAVLGGLLAFAAHRSALPVWVAVLLGLAYGATDEIHQMFVPGRSPDVWDWAADAAGVAAATYLYFRWRMGRGAPGGAPAPGAPYLEA